MVKGFDKVISRASVMNYPESNKAIPIIAQELGVAYILTGSFRMADEQVVITANLVQGESEKIIAPYRYNRPYADIFEIQSEVARDIADQLKVKLTPNEIGAIKSQPTQNLQAYKLFKKAYDLNPQLTLATYITHLFSAAEKNEQAVNYANIILNNNLFSQGAYSTIIAYYFDGQVEKAIQLIDDGFRKFGYAHHAVINSASRERAYKNHEVEMYWLKVEPLFEPLRDDPHWQQMLDNVGFPE